MDMKILRESIEYDEDYRDIYTLKFLKDNPRVYAVTHGEPGFEQKPEGEQQDIILKTAQGRAQREETSSRG